MNNVLDIFEADYEVRKLATTLITQYHRHLEQATILYLMTTKNTMRSGKLVLGKATKPAGLVRFLSSAHVAQEEPADFIITLNSTAWEERLTESQKEALLDHELCHCGYELNGDDEVKWVIRPHDVEEFAEIIERHGLWEPELERMADAIEQLKLPLASVKAQV